MRLVACTRRILEELDVSDTNETDAVKTPQRVRAVSYVPGALRNVGIFEDRFKSRTIVRRRDESQLAQDQDVDELDCHLRVEENCDEGDCTMSVETMPFEVQVECTRRRDGGKESLKF